MVGVKVVAFPSVGFNVVGGPLEEDVAGFTVVGFPVDAVALTVGCSLKLVVGFAVAGAAAGLIVLGKEVGIDVAAANVGRAVDGRTVVGKTVVGRIVAGLTVVGKEVGIEVAVASVGRAVVGSAVVVDNDG